jgi:hypothetical protein
MLIKSVPFPVSLSPSRYPPPHWEIIFPYFRAKIYSTAALHDECNFAQQIRQQCAGGGGDLILCFLIQVLYSDIVIYNSIKYTQFTENMSKEFSPNFNIGL